MGDWSVAVKQDTPNIKGDQADGMLASLRIQTTAANKSEFPSVSPERLVA